ncbi:MAG: tetratricopeptide repeat protein [Thiovulaceae bacterium]|nr:tetratricopeptide repeat protein [Sulfurimonadaceae bacterium]
MKRALSFIVFASLLPISLLSSEPSAFGAGDLDSPSPYGLTQSEKVVLENKQKLDGLRQKTSSVDNKIDSLRERVDGFQTVVEGISKTSHQNSLDIQTLLTNSRDSSDSKDARNQKIDQLIKTNSDNLEKLRLLMTDMSTVVDTINKNYVSKEEYNSLVKDVNDMKSLLGSKVKSSAKSSGDSLDSMGTAKVYSKAEAYYKSKDYDKAKECYDYLISKNYKAAYSSYMAGEVSYKTKNYSDAISYYKESGTRNETATYMPTLMLHTAIAMQKTKDNDTAKKFLGALITNYPKSSESKDAKKILSSLK